MKKSLLARMGLRQRDLTWAGRETLDLYCRSKSKITAIDTWLETNPMIDAAGRPAAVLKVYFVAMNASQRHLEALRGIVRSLAEQDRDMASALAAIDAETREGQITRS